LPSGTIEEATDDARRLYFGSQMRRASTVRRTRIGSLAAPRGVVRETTQTDVVAQDGRPTLRFLLS
jgi:hypothetical protein